MTYDTTEARQQLLDELAVATDAIGRGLAALGEAFELLDDFTADTLERELFRPVQTAYGRAQRTHAEFAARHGLPGRTFAAPPPGLASQGVKGFVDAAVYATTEADARLGQLQDSMLPVEVGDAELRAGLSEVRRLVDGVPVRARELVRTFGR